VQWPTPAGDFYIRNKLTRYQSAFYGRLAFGTSARSAVLTDWPAGGFIGIHGTNEPELLPGRVSHGCIRMRNADILRLGRLMPVGTPLTIR
jgi:lipoprotein-anchoring transpeptidase ErfK/SrfK